MRFRAMLRGLALGVGLRAEQLLAAAAEQSQSAETVMAFAEAAPSLGNAADALGIHPNTVAHWLSQLLLQTINIGTDVAAVFESAASGAVPWKAAISEISSGLR